MGNTLRVLAERRNNDRTLLCQALLLHLQSWRIFQENSFTHLVDAATRNVQRDLEALPPDASKSKPNASDSKPPCSEIPADVWNAYRAAHP
jgi:hypothetical protein